MASCNGLQGSSGGRRIAEPGRCSAASAESPSKLRQRRQKDRPSPLRQLVLAVVLGLKYSACQVSAICTERGMSRVQAIAGGRRQSKRGVFNMFNVTRRQALAASGGLLGAMLAPKRFASAAGNTLTIAYNVNLPSFDPTVGPSAVNPTIQAIYRSIFDQYIGQKPDLVVQARPADRLGLERRQDQGVDGRARGRRLARRHAVHARGRRLVARARRRAETAAIRSSSSGRRSATYKIDGNRITARRACTSSRRCSSGWRSSPATSCPRPITRRSARKASRRSRSAPAPTWSTPIEGNAFLRLKANPQYWGGKPAFETVVFKFVPDATSRVAEIEIAARPTSRSKFPTRSSTA